jgi:hypothetical protein
MELNIARNAYFSYTDSHISFSEFSNYIKKGIRIWQNAKKFPADSESLKAVKIAISYRDQLIKFFPHNWKNHFYAN